MSQKLMLGWALGATLIAVGSLSYNAGKLAGRTGPATALPMQIGEATDTGTRARPAEPVYRVPESLQEMPGQWRSVVNGNASGYSVLFDTHRRRFIAEVCDHAGYGVDGSIEVLGLLCEVLLRGQLASLDETEATLLDRSGNAMTVRLDLDRQGEIPLLTLNIDGHKVQLVPGNRNDLLQDMEALPEIQEQKRAFLMAIAKPRAERTQ